MKTYLIAILLLLFTSVASAETAEELFEQGYKYENEYKYKEAFEVYAKAIKMKPDDAEIYFRSGIAGEQLTGYIALAILDYSKVIELNPRAYLLAESYKRRAFLYEKQQEYNKALQDIDKAIELNYDDVAFLYKYRGDLYTKVKNYTEAIASYTKAISLKPDDAEAYFKRSTAYSYFNSYALTELEKFNLAIDDCNKAIELRPNDEKFNRLLTILIGRKKEIQESINNKIKDEQAIQDISKNIELNPNDLFLYKRRGDLYTKIGEKDLAKEDYKKFEPMKKEQEKSQRNEMLGILSFVIPMILINYILPAVVIIIILVAIFNFYKMRKE